MTASRFGRWARGQGAFVLCCVLAAGSVVAAYSNHFDNGFHFDDNHVIVNNLAIRSLGNAGAFFTDANTFTSRPENASYRPLLTLSFALDYRRAGGLVPSVFHTTQFGLLLALGCLLVPLYRQLCEMAQPAASNRYVALFAATVACIHTANTETVNYFSSRSSLVASLGVVAGFLLYTRWPRGRRTLAYLVPVVIGGLAKPLAVMFAPLLVCYVYLFEQRGSLSELPGAGGRRKAWAAIGAGLPALVVGGVLFGLLARMASDSLTYAVIGRWEYLLSQPYVWLHYFRLFFWPVGLTADTDWKFDTTLGDPSLWVGVLFVAALVAAIGLASRSRVWRPTAFGLAWFALTLLPTSSIVPLSEVYNEHRIFFPYLGLTLAATWTGVRLSRWAVARRPQWRSWAPLGAMLAAAGVIAALGLGTYERNRVWRDDESLWRDVTVKSPANGRGLMNYGLTLMRRGKLEQALEYFDRALVFNPSYPFLEVNLGIAKGALGRHDEAEPHFLRALTLDPRFGQGRYFFAGWLNERGRGPEALRQLEQAVVTSPWELGTRHMLMLMYAAVGRRDSLLELARETLRMAPGDATAAAYAAARVPFRVEEETAEAYAAIGRTHLNLERWPEAAAINRHALSLDAGSAVAWNNLGWALGNLGFHDDAVPCFREAFRLDPEMTVARNNLAWALGQKKAPTRPR